MAFLDETGLTHLWDKITNKFLAKSNVANNLTTTSEGYALDARQGAALMSAINGSSGMKLSGSPIIISDSNNDTGITLEKNAFCSFVTYVYYADSNSTIYEKIIITVNNKTVDLCISEAGANAANRATNNAFVVLPKGTKITLDAYIPSATNGTGNATAVIQYFE